MTPAALLVEHKLGRSLHAYLSSLVADGLSWRQIACRIGKDAGVSVSHETARTWWKALDGAEAGDTAA